MVDGVQQIDDASALADLAGYAPYLSTEQKTTLLEIINITAPHKALNWPRNTLPSRTSTVDPQDIQEGMENSSRTCCASNWPPSARNWPTWTANRRLRSRT